MDFNPSCLLSMSKDGCQKITAMHITLKVAVKGMILHSFIVHVQVNLSSWASVIIMGSSQCALETINHINSTSILHTGY